MKEAVAPSMRIEYPAFFAHLMIFQGVGLHTYFCSEQSQTQK